jgi:hypothetical protein
MLPLGDAWAGGCLAQPEHPVEPEDACLPLCNLGYARGVCARFPSATSPDAVRFAISRDDGESLQIYYVRERGHHPFDHGRLEYRRPQGSFLPALPATPLNDQALAYVTSYLRRKGAAAGSE